MCSIINILPKIREKVMIMASQICFKSYLFDLKFLFIFMYGGLFVSCNRIYRRHAHYFFFVKMIRFKETNVKSQD